MCHRTNNKKFLYIFLLVIIFLSGCSNLNLGKNGRGFIERIISRISKIWENVTQAFDNLLISIGDMFSGLSGIGEALRNMFRNFSIF